MSLSDLASLGSFLSGIGVLVSLVYLSLQIRQNTRAVRSQSQARTGKSRKCVEQFQGVSGGGGGNRTRNRSTYSPVISGG